jgi:MFS family permease
MTLAATASPSVRSAAVPLILVVIAGCVIAAITNGIRTSFGLFTLPATAELGLSREAWGMAMAIQNLVWGLAQPFAGAIADRRGTARVVIVGLILYAAGLVLMVVSPSALLLDLSAGVLCGVGIAASSFSIVMIAFGRNVPQEKRPLIFGVATAASSFGQFAFAPIGQGFISAFGWQSALVYLAAFLALALALTFALRGKTEQSSGVADLPEIIEGLELLGTIPHVDHFEVTQNTKVDLYGNDVDVVVYAEFADEAALAAYKAHPTYAEATRRVRPLRDLRFAADVEAVPAEAVRLRRAV